MTQEPVPDGRSGWLWIAVMAGLAILIVIWLVSTWRIESDVKVGASAEGLEFPARSGMEVSAPAQGEEAPAKAE